MLIGPKRRYQHRNGPNQNDPMEIKMAMPIFSNRAPRVQYRDGLIFVELVTEGVDGTEITTTLALTRYTAISLGTGLVASERLENDNVYQFDKHIGEVQTH